ALRGEADAYAHARTALSTALAALDAQRGGETCTDAEFDALCRVAREAEDAVAANLREQAQLEMRIEHLRARLLDASLVQARLARATAAQEVYARLAADLRADAFQSWLLRECLERLVDGASVRLMTLSGRY